MGFSISKLAHLGNIGFTGSVGDIEHIYLDDIEDLIKVLHVPLLIGHPEFKLEGVLLKHNFSEEDIFELNYINSISVQKLKMDEIINNNQLVLFEDQRICILKDLHKEKDEIDMAIKTVLSNEKIEEEIDDLPF